MPILVGIDGTGSAVMPGRQRDIDYDRAFANSFVRTICNRASGQVLYRRGPVALGGGLSDAITAGVNHVVSSRRSNPGAPVLLTGYSRGAAGVVVVAKRLKSQNINVAAMLLFDCVDRHLFIDAEIIPDNVAHVFHVQRHPDAGSRESFGNDGMRYYPAKTKYEPIERFLCTHGGMGGCPWEIPPGGKGSDIIDEGFGAGSNDGPTNVTYDQDARVSRDVWAACVPFMQRYGFI